MKDKIINYLFIAVSFAVFIVLYLHINNDEVRQVFIYFLIFLGLYFSLEFANFVVLTNFIGIILLFQTTSHYWLLPTIGLSSLLMFTIIIPFYFKKKYGTERKNFIERFKPLSNRFRELQEELKNFKDEKVKFEKEIEKINKLYVLGRELVEHVDINEVVEHLQRVLLDRPGIKSIFICIKEKANWKPLFFSNPENKKQWMDFLHSKKNLAHETEACLVTAPGWIAQDAIVFWPVRSEKGLLAAIFLITEQDAASRYLEEGAIFIPQIALGLIRMRLFEKVRDRSRIDGLTGLYRRGYFIERFQAEIKRSERYKSIFSLLMIDIDFFKKINDTYGHLVGDDVLSSLSKILDKYVRPGDMIGRYGGEEFIILIHMSSPKDSIEIANRIRKVVEENEFVCGELKLHITISIGMSNYPTDGTTVEDLLSRADKSLYWVKQHGRNGVKIYDKSL